jgi:hypothetical protein
MILLIASNLTFLIIGLIVGSRIPKVELKLPNPVEKIQEIKRDIEENKEAERFKIIAENIDNYNGTSIGQKDLP